MKYKNIEIETEQVDMMQGAQRSEEFTAIAPDQTLPALVTDEGIVLTQVIGICTYLEAIYPEKPLLGTTPLEKALVSSWDQKIYSMLFMAIAEALRNSSPGMAGRALPGPLDLEQIPELAERGKYRLNWAWGELDKELADRKWIAGDNFSFADIDMAVCAGFSGWVKCTPGQDLTNLQGYLARVQAELNP